MYEIILVKVTVGLALGAIETVGSGVGVGNAVGAAEGSEVGEVGT